MSGKEDASSSKPIEEKEASILSSEWDENSRIYRMQLLELPVHSIYAIGRVIGFKDRKDKNSITATPFCLEDVYIFDIELQAMKFNWLTNLRFLSAATYKSQGEVTVYDEHQQYKTISLPNEIWAQIGRFFDKHPNHIQDYPCPLSYKISAQVMKLWQEKIFSEPKGQIEKA